MDDRLQRRLRDADPLTAGDGRVPDPARLDAIKEQLMLSETQGSGAAPAPEGRRAGGPSFRPRAIRITALAAAGLAAVLVVGTLARPTSSALAWDPTPVSASDAQKAAATDACALPDVPAGGAQVTTGSGQVTTGSGPVTVSGPAVGVTSGGPAGTDQGVVISGGDIPAGSSAVPALELPAMPDHLPPLVYLELHGTGAVAVFADAKSTAYCLLVKDGDGFKMAGMQVALGDGATVGAGSITGMTGAGASSGGAMSGAIMAGDGDFTVSAMVLDYGTDKLGIIAGTAPAGATTVKVKGGPADGATATVAAGRFALWAPKALDGAATVVALDASGADLGHVDIAAPPPPPAQP